MAIAYEFVIVSSNEESLMSQGRQDKTPTGLWGLFGLVVVFSLTMSVGRYIATKSAAPDTSMRIAATLVSWGLKTDGLSIGVSEDEIKRKVALLLSPDGEERVGAAQWLAARGVRESGPQIATAMADEGTLRPCQLAHSLGMLGDEQWIGTLVAAAKQPDNLDLKACAKLALCELASPKSVDVLLDLCRSESSRKMTLEALGRISDPSALEFLRSVAASAHDEIERDITLRAIERIELMQQADPIPLLIARVQIFGRRGHLETWAVRTLARLHDVRAIPALQDVLRHPQSNRNERIVVAAGLLAHGEAGSAALQQTIDSQPQSNAARTAMAALRLIDTTGDIPTLVSR